MPVKPQMPLQVVDQDPEVTIGAFHESTLTKLAFELPGFAHEIYQLVQDFTEHSYGEQCPHKMMYECIAGDKKLLVATKDHDLLAVAIISVIQYQTGMRTMQIHGWAGPNIIKYGQQLLDNIKQIAREVQCENVTATGRDGWIKFLQEQGFVKIYSTFRCELGEAS